MFQYNDDMGLGKYKESASHIKLKAKLDRAVKRLRGRQKKTVQLYLKGYSQSKIGAILQISKTSVAEYFYRAVKTIKQNS